MPSHAQYGAAKLEYAIVNGATSRIFAKRFMKSNYWLKKHSNSIFHAESEKKLSHFGLRI